MRPNAVIIGILGLWFIVAGIIGLSFAANMWSDWIAGIIVAVLGFSMAAAAPGSGIVAGILGIWMIVSSFIPAVNSGAGARWEEIIVGVIIAIIGFSSPRRATPLASDIRRAA